jgi:predicted regulator of Ras-like GTPase activity (Roadblock/LC7/MglB family)
MRTEMLGSILDELADACRTVGASWVVSTDGLTLASRRLADSDEDRLGTLSATLGTLGEQIAADFVGGEGAEIVVKGDSGVLVAMPAGPDLMLAATAGCDGVTEVALAMSRAAARIAALFQALEEEARL